MVVVHSDTNLPQVIEATDSASRFTSRLNGRKQETYQNPDDGNDSQQFHQREPETPIRLPGCAQTTPQFRPTAELRHGDNPSAT
jgi:hypothetical protein